MSLEEVKRAVKQLEEKGLRPTVRAVRRLLGHGSHRDILAHLRELRGQPPRPKCPELEALRSTINSLREIVARERPRIGLLRFMLNTLDRAEVRARKELRALPEGVNPEPHVRALNEARQARAKAFQRIVELYGAAALGSQVGQVA